VRDKKVTEISALRDESDREGMRIVVELKRDAIPQVVLNQLYKHTQMQSTFGTILLALVDGVPKVMTLREMLLHFIDHRHVVVVKRSEFDLRKAKEREHILEGLKIAVDNIDEVIKIIRGSTTRPTASTRLQEGFELSEVQAEAILNMRLARLTGLEMEKLEAELGRSGPASPSSRTPGQPGVRMGSSRTSSRRWPRSTATSGAPRSWASTRTSSMEDLIADEEMVLTISHQGYVKRIPIDTYRSQRAAAAGCRGWGRRRRTGSSTSSWRPRTTTS
jgi:DNA gyrase subunit A